MTRAHASAAEVSGRTFVGRKPELGELRAGLDRAIAGRGGVFLVAGEPGIGKSELADRLPPGQRIVRLDDSCCRWR